MVTLKLIRGPLPTRVYYVKSMSIAIHRAKALAELHSTEYFWEGLPGTAYLVVDASKYYEEEERS